MKESLKGTLYDEALRSEISGQDPGQDQQGKPKIVIKRDGSEEKFTLKKIKDAVLKAYDAAGLEMPATVSRRFGYYLNKFSDLINDDKIHVEDIQDVIEYFLMKTAPDVAKLYILYRSKHKTIRDFVNKKREWIENYKKADNTADATVDDNSNVANRNIGIINAEIHKEDNQMLNRGMVTAKLKELFPDFSSKQYLQDLDSHILYKNDEKGFAGIAPYCVSITMYPFILNGLKEIGGMAAAPKNLDSYCGLFINLIFAVAGQFAGAVATPEFLLYFDWYARKDLGEEYYLHTDEFVEMGYQVRKLQKLTGWTKVIKCIDNIKEIIDGDYSDAAKKLAQELYDSYKDGKLKDNTRTIKSFLHQKFQQVIYSINQPAAARGMQSAFINFSYFDKPYFEAMFGKKTSFCFPDFTTPKWESLNWLQKDFMMWFNQERLRCILTFPVESFALIYKNGKFEDEDSARFVAEEYARGHSFFTYISDTADSLSSCCFGKDEKVLWKVSPGEVHLTTFEEFYNYKNKKNLRIYHNGSWVSGRAVRLPADRQMYNVVLDNNDEYILSDNHINPTLYGEKTTDALNTDDYLLYNTMPLQACPEDDLHLTYEQGYLIGTFLGDGSLGAGVKGTIYDINLSLNESKYNKMIKILNKGLNDTDPDAGRFRLSTIYNNVWPVRVSSKKTVAFIQEWTKWYRGTMPYNKNLNMNCLLQSTEFRKGILDGWHDTDGTTSNRCYTTSVNLLDCMKALVSSLGMIYVVNKDDRQDEESYIRDVKINHNYPVYCLQWYSPGNARRNKSNNISWIKRNNSIYIKIKSIEKIDYNNKYIYCVECKNHEEPYFTLPSGLITHNCRLKNKVTSHEFSFTNGNIGVETGSKSVISLNINRIVQDYYNSTDIPFASDTMNDWYAGFRRYIGKILKRVYKYHIAYNELLWDMYDAGLLTVYKAGFIALDKQYMTIGLNGVSAAAEFLGLDITDNDDYKQFCHELFGTIKANNQKANGMYFGHKLTFNTEEVPAESLAVKNYDWDKADGYWVPKDINLYTSYNFKPYDPTISVLEKMRMHGRDFNGDWLDGGAAAHINLSEHLTAEQNWKLLNYAGEVGCSYFTYNVPNVQCRKCGYITKHPIDKCPKCGSTELDWYDRIIGYLTKIANWSAGRRKEQKRRVYESEKETGVEKL